MQTAATDTVSDIRERELRPWVAHATVLIWDRVADARAHARDGRITEAGQRLEELQTGLVGDPKGRGSILSNARAAFYRSAFRHRPHDPAIHQVVHAQPEGELVAQYAEILGRNQYADLRAAVDQTAESLKRLTAAGGTPEQLVDWERRERERLIAQTRRNLSDAQVALSEAISYIRIKPDLR